MVVTLDEIRHNQTIRCYIDEADRALKTLFNNACNMSKTVEDAISTCVKDIRNAMI